MMSGKDFGTSVNYHEVSAEIYNLNKIRNKLDFCRYGHFFNAACSKKYSPSLCLLSFWKAESISFK